MFVKLPMQELQIITDAVASMDQNLPINESHFFLNQRSAVTMLIFNKRCNERRSDTLRKQ